MARRRLLAVSSLPLLLMCGDAQAWTPTTHVYLAQKAWEDAQDGRVTINLVDHDGRVILGRKGEYEVSPEILAAIKANPHAFFSGVLGPDAYPDIATGQMRIHPPGHAHAGPDANTNGAGTDGWLTKLWVASHSNPNRTGPNLAFTTGYLAHAAGDMFAHTFVNTFTGGIFDLMGLNGLKHITLEGYIGMRTPALASVSYPLGGSFGGESVAAGSSLPIFQAVDRFGLDNGVKQFVAETMVSSPIVAMPVGGGGGEEKNKQFSVPSIFADLRTELRSSVTAYEEQEAPYRERMAYTQRLAFWSASNMPGVLARACGKPAPAAAPCPDLTVGNGACPPEYPTADPAFCAGVVIGTPAMFSVAMSVLAAAAVTEWSAWNLFGLRQLHYLQQQSQINEINIGLESWVETSHNAALAWFFNPDGLPDVSSFVDEYTWFATHRLISMVTGLPSWPIDTFGEVIDFIPNLIRPVIERMKRDFVDFILRSAFGADLNTLRERLTRPQVWLDPLFQANRSVSPPPGGLPSMSLARANAIMNVPIGDASDIANPNVTKKTWTVDNQPGQKVFPAAYNSMVMIKLLMLKPSEVDRLISDLGGSARMVSLGANIDGNPMLGFLETIDGSHQWANGPRMVFARDCNVYRSLFMNQRPFPALAGEPIDPVLGSAEPADILSACGIQKPIPGLKGVSKVPNLVPNTPIIPLPTKRGALTAAALKITANDPKPLADGELPAHPPDALFPGQSTVLTVAPSEVPHRWSLVSGSGKLTDPVDPRTGATPQAQAAKVAEIDRRIAHATVGSAVCRDVGCVKRVQSDVVAIKRERRAALSAMKLVSAAPLIGANVVYEAPANVARPETVTIRAEATDGSGRSTTFTLAILPKPPPLKIASPTAVKAGGSFSLVADPPIPMKWVVVSGPAGGVVGDPSSPVRAQLMSQTVRPFTSSIRQADTKLLALPPEPTAPAPSAARRFDRGPRVLRPAAAPLAERERATVEKKTLIQSRQKDLAAAMKKVQEIDGTYKAPTKVRAPQTVVLRGTALDGTNRSTTITVQVTP